AQNNALAKALAECREVGPLLQGNDGHDVRFVRWFADGRRVLTASWSAVRVWDARSGKKLVEFHGPQLRITSVALSPDDRRIALTFERHYEYGLVEVNGQQRKGFLVTERVARVHDADTGAEVHVLRGHGDQVNSVAFSPDGKRLVTASWDGTARLWDVTSGR